MSTYKEHKAKAKEFLKTLDGFFPNYEKIYDEFNVLEVNPEDQDNNGYATVIFDAGNRRNLC